MIERRQNSRSGIRQQIKSLLGGCVLALGVALIVWRTSDRLQERHDGQPAPEQASAVPAATSPAPASVTEFRTNSLPTSERFLVRFSAQLQSLQKVHDSIVLQEEMVPILESLSPDELSQAVQFLQQAEQTRAVRELSRPLVRLWAEHDPQAAANRLMELPAGEMRRDALEQVALGWAIRDPAGAREWAGAIASVGERQEALLTIGDQLTRTAPVEAVNLAVRLPSDGRSDALLCRAVGEWAARDSKAAVAWVRAIPDSALKEQALAGALSAGAAQDPRSAAELAVSELRSPHLQADAVGIIAQHWGQRDPEALAAWVNHLPSGELQRTVTKNILAIWEQELKAHPIP